MFNKLILAITVIILTISLSIALDSQGTQEPGNALANTETEVAEQAMDQGSQTANDSLFLEDFNSVNDPYKETLFATGQGNRNECLGYYVNLTGALASFQEKYKTYRPSAIKSDKQFSEE